MTMDGTGVTTLGTRPGQESIEARLAKLEQQTEWLFVELAQARSALESMVSAAGEALLSDL